MDMSIHQDKCKNDDLEFVLGYKYPVHSGTVIFFIIEHDVDVIPICVKMPAVRNWHILTPDKLDIQSKIILDALKQKSVNFHNTIKLNIVTNVQSVPILLPSPFFIDWFKDITRAE